MIRMSPDKCRYSRRKKYIEKLNLLAHIVFHLYWEGIPNLNSQNSRKAYSIQLIF